MGCGAICHARRTNAILSSSLHHPMTGVRGGPRGPMFYESFLRAASTPSCLVWYAILVHALRRVAGSRQRARTCRPSFPPYASSAVERTSQESVPEAKSYFSFLFLVVLSFSLSPRPDILWLGFHLPPQAAVKSACVRACVHLKNRRIVKSWKRTGPVPKPTCPEEKR